MTASGVAIVGAALSDGGRVPTATPFALHHQAVVVAIVAVAVISGSGSLE